MQTASIRSVLTELARLLDLRAEHLRAEGTLHGPRWERVRQLREHVTDYLLPRARNLEAPVVAVVIGSTGAGKSSLVNAIAGRRVTASGVLRPTTRKPVVVASPDDASRLNEGEILPGMSSRGELEVVTPPLGGRTGVVVVDAPDIDSVESNNHALAVELLDAADLCIVVTTAARYADHVPWQVLTRARQRGLPMLALINRLPGDRGEAADVVEDYERMLARHGLDRSGPQGELELVPVMEGSVDRSIDGLKPAAVRPVTTALDRLATNKRQRQELAERALQGALHGVGWRIEAVADDIEAEHAIVERLRAHASETYEQQTQALIARITEGRFLREEVMRQWHEFVHQGAVARGLMGGVERLRGMVRTWIQPPAAAPVDEVEEGAFTDLTALAVSHAHEAARRTATTWSFDPLGTQLLAADGTLWANSEDLGAELRGRLERWIGEIAALIGQEGDRRRVMARAASVGVNVVGVGVMLAAFGATGGLTGAEFGIAAATAVLNQRLLESIFGEATVRTLVARSRSSLLDLLSATMERDRSRFDRALDRVAPDAELAHNLRAAARQLSDALR